MTTKKPIDDLLPPSTGVGSEPPDGYRSEIPPTVPNDEVPEVPVHPLDEAYGVHDDGADGQESASFGVGDMELGVFARRPRPIEPHDPHG